eukprot:5245710-Amphidinium_carterae.1
MLFSALTGLFKSPPPRPPYKMAFGLYDDGVRSFSSCNLHVQRQVELLTIVSQERHKATPAQVFTAPRCRYRPEKPPSNHKTQTEQTNSELDKENDKT